jgi:DNA-binding NarL/FixJ family response regulator
MKQPNETKPTEKTRPATVVLIAERALLRDALGEALACGGEFHVVGSVANVSEALELLRQGVHLVLIDAAHAQEAVAAASRIAIEAPSARVVMLDPWADAHRCRTAMDNGLAAYLDERQSLADLRAALRRVLAGERVTAPNLANLRKPHFRTTPGKHSGDPAVLEQLTSREREVLELLVRGTDMDTVAAQMKVSRSTVEHYRARLLKRFGFRRFPELAYWMLTAGVL